MADRRKVPDSLSRIHHAGRSDGAGGETPATAHRVLRTVFDGESFAVLPLFVFYLLVALGLTGWTYYAGDEPSGTLTAAELGVQSIGRVAVLVIDAVLLVLVLLAWGGATPLLRRRVPAGAAYGVTLVLAVLVMLTASGEVRDWAVARYVPAPPDITREQGFDMAKAGYERSFPGFAGEPQPASYFEGVWRRQGRLYHSDLRRLEIRRSGDEMQVRIWHECNPGGAPCDAGEVAAQVARSADGLIASLAATVEIPEGRLWMRMARGRQQNDSAVIVTQVYLRERPEWQVSSGGAVELWREKLPVPVADFLGDWARSFPGEIGDFTRLTLRETAPGRHAMRAWARCEEKRECDLGESPLQVEAEAETGLVRAVRSRFSSKGRELLVSLEPPRQGRSFAVTENSEITYETYVVPQGRSSSRSIVQEKGRSTATRRIALQRGHPAEPFAAVVAAGPLGVAPAAEGRAMSEGCAGIDDLHLAVIRDCIDRLGSLKVGLEQRNRLGQTPLALAVLQNKPAMVKALLAQGADINAPIRFGEGDWPVSSGLQRAQRPELAAGSTPLIMARDAAMVSLLLQAGAGKDVKNGYGWSAIFYYTHHGSVEMLDTLLAAGADINATADVDPSHRGTTALMWAAYMNRTPHLQILLKYQPKRDIRDAAGKTALDYAKGFGHAEAVRLLSSPAP